MGSPLSRGTEILWGEENELLLPQVRAEDNSSSGPAAMVGVGGEREPAPVIAGGTESALPNVAKVLFLCTSLSM